MANRGSMMALVLLACGGGDQVPVAPQPAQEDTDQVQPALATAVDGSGHLWIAAGYTDVSMPGGSSMGLSLRSPDGTWVARAPLAPVGPRFRPSGDAWLAAAQQGHRAYYVSLLQTQEYASQQDDLGDGVDLAVVDFSGDAPRVSMPRRIDPGDWPHWDEPTVSATRPPGASAEAVLVAGTPIAPDTQDAIAVLVSRDSGATFHEVPLVRAPEYPGHHSPHDTLVRPVLQQDPRPGQECHAYLAFGVYYPTAFATTAGTEPPACQSTPAGCRSIAETQTSDCGETWAPATFIAVDTGSPQGEDFRGFSYAVADDGTRLVMFGDEDADDAPILLKRAAPGASFTVVQGGRWDDGPMETVASGPGVSGEPVRRWRPTLAASARVAALWVEEDTVSHSSSLRMSTSPSPAAQWSTPRLVDEAGIACDQVTFPSDDYMTAVPDAPFGSAASDFVVAWAPFIPCGSQVPRHVRFDEVR